MRPEVSEKGFYKGKGLDACFSWVEPQDAQPPQAGILLASCSVASGRWLERKGGGEK